MPVAEPGPNPQSTKGQNCVLIHSPRRLRTKVALSWEAGSLAFILDLLFLSFPVHAAASKALHLSLFVPTQAQGL